MLAQKTLEYAIENGASWGSSPGCALILAGGRYDLSDLQIGSAFLWAHDHGCPCDCPDSGNNIHDDGDAQDDAHFADVDTD